MRDTTIVNTSKIFDSTIRIQILASLCVSPLIYKQLKEVCQCADGMMTFHTNKLKEAGFINVQKDFVNNRPQTTYSITSLGRKEFKAFVSLLNKSIQ